MFQNLFLLFTVLCTASTSKLPIAPENLVLTCKTVEEVIPSNALDMEKFQGTWYYQKTFVPLPFPFDPMACWTSNITKFESPQGPMVSSEWCAESNGKWDCEKDYLKIEQAIFPLESAWYLLNRNDNATVYPLAPTIWVQTDNENWALSYECSVIEGFNLKLESMTLYARQPIYDNEEVLNEVDTLVQNHGFSKHIFMPSNNTVCAEK